MLALQNHGARRHISLVQDHFPDVGPDVLSTSLGFAPSPASLFYILFIPPTHLSQKYTKVFLDVILVYSSSMSFQQTGTVDTNLADPTFDLLGLADGCREEKRNH